MSLPGPVIGVVHLLPLPGSPSFSGDLGAIAARAAEDARAYARGGADGIIVENYGDTPFLKEGLPPEAVAAFALCAAAARDASDLPFGTNALRNDARAALGIAVATGASWIRVNVLAGVVATDQGIIEGRAAELLRARAALGADRVMVLADAHVKHGRPLFATDLVQAARDTVGRGGADALVVSGLATGSPTDLDDLRAVREALPDAFLLAGSGVTQKSVAAVLAIADAVIVGTAVKSHDTASPVDEKKVRAFVRAASEASRPT